MRAFLVAFSVLVVTLMVSLDANAEGTDRYSISLVKHALLMRADGQRVVQSWSVKNISRLGDGVSIALLKILDERELLNPTTIAQFLPIIRDSFSQPGLIAFAVDKQPNVTLFLLDFLKQKTTDSQALAEIVKTVEFVKEKTASTP
jgi:hypothetical protein